MCAEMQDNRVRTVWNVLYFNIIIVFCYNGIINQQLYLTSAMIEFTAVRAFIISKLTFYMDKIGVVDPGLSIEMQRGARQGYEGGF